MSYRNPARIVDTQSGQHFRNMQQSLAEAFTGVINADTERIRKEAKQTEKEQALVIRRIEKQDQEARDAANQSSTESGTATVWNLENALKANAYATGLKPGQRTEDDKKVLSNMRNLKPKLMSVMSNVVSYEEEFNSILNLPQGSEGGLNKWSKTNTSKIKGLSIFYTGKNGRSEGDFNPLTGQATMKAYWKGENGEELATEIGSEGVDIELDIVPDTKKARVDMSKSLLNMIKLEKGNNPVFDGAEITSQSDDNTGITTWSRKPKKEAVEKALYPEALATVMAMTAAEGIAWNNNRNGVTPDSKEFITSSYTDSERYIKDKKGNDVPRPEIVAIAKALAKNTIETEGKALIANIPYAGIGKPEENQLRQFEVNRARNKEKYKESVAIVDSYGDDLSFNRYSTNSSFNNIKEFAGQASIGLADAIKPQTAEDDDTKIIGFTVKYLDGKGSAAVKPGMSDEKVRNIIKRAMRGGQEFYEETPVKKKKGKFDNLNKEN